MTPHLEWLLASWWQALITSAVVSGTAGLMPLDWVGARCQIMSDRHLRFLESAFSTISRATRWWLEHLEVVIQIMTLGVALGMVVLRYFSLREDAATLGGWLLYGLVFWLLLLWVPFQTLATRLNNTIAIPAKSERLRRAALADARPPILCLRSFSRRTLWGFSYVEGSRHGSVSVTFNYLDDIAAAASSFAPVVCVGGPVNADSVGFDVVADNLIVLPSRDDWRELFEYAAEGALALLVVPGDSRGLEEEIDFIVTHHWSRKTLVFMPPVPKFRPEKHAVILKRAWNGVRETFQGKGLLLPEYRADGLLYVPNADFSVDKTAQPGTTPAELHAALAGLISHLDSGQRPISRLVELADRRNAQSRRGPRRVSLRWLVFAATLLVSFWVVSRLTLVPPIEQFAAVVRSAGVGATEHAVRAGSASELELYFRQRGIELPAGICDLSTQGYELVGGRIASVTDPRSTSAAGVSAPRQIRALIGSFLFDDIERRIAVFAHRGHRGESVTCAAYRGPMLMTPQNSRIGRQGVELADYRTGRLTAMLHQEGPYTRIIAASGGSHATIKELAFAKALERRTRFPGSAPRP